MLNRFFLDERNILVAIFINSMIIFALYFPQIEESYPSIYRILDGLDHFFVVLFMLEALVKIRALGRKQYFADSWNVFDFLIVVASIPGFLNFMPFFASANTSVFKILRLLRMVRLLRFIRFIPHLESILSGLGRALRASIFVILVLVFFNFMLAMLTCHMYGDLVPDYFGDPLISSYYIFQMFTVEGWNEIPNVVAQAAAEQKLSNYAVIAGATRFYFILVVLFGGIFGMSLANAIFVDEMTLDNNREMEAKVDEIQQQLAELKKLLEKKE